MLITNETADIIFKIFIYFSIGSLIIYLPRLLYYVEGFKKPLHFENPVKNKIAVLVPSRYEKGVVHLLDSLENQSYDKKYFDTFVIFAGDDDPSIELCKNYKNMTPVVIKNQTCKGDALDGAVQKILHGKKKYASYIIVDADNIVHKDFVLEMNNALMSGRDIILGKRSVKNYLFEKKYRNWVVNCSGLIYTFLDKLGNSFRSKYSMHGSICGTGIMITSKIIDELGGWPYRSVTEDFEFAISSLINDKTILFYEQAITYTEETMSHKSSNDRRRRWLLGYAQVSKSYRKKVHQKYLDDKEILKKNNLSKEEHFKVRGNFWGCFDFLYSFIPLGTFFAPACICCIIFLVAGFSSWFNTKVLNASVLNLFEKAGIILLVLYGVLFVYTLIGILVDRKNLKISFIEKLIVAFINPFFISEFAVFFIEAFIKIARGKENTTWVMIDRIDDTEINLVKK